MSVIQKTRRGRKIIAFCLLTGCILTMASARNASAAPSTHPVTLTVEQVFTMPEKSAADDTFTYQVTALETGSPMPSGSVAQAYTFTIDGTGDAAVGAIDFTRAGVYRYEIKQVITAPKTGYDYDGQVYAVAIYVKNSGAGLASEVIVQNSGGDKVGSIRFENAYNPLASDPAVMVDPPVKKIVTGSPSRDSTFTFKLEAKDASNPMPVGSKDGVKTMTIVGSGQKDFGTWSYTVPGSYNYMISEVNTGEADYKYDTTVYTITDSVTDVDGRLVVTRTVTDGAGRRVSACAFTNEYKPVDSSNKPVNGSNNPVNGSNNPVNGGIFAPKTGDSSGMARYVIPAVTALLVLLALAAWKRKQKQAF